MVLKQGREVWMCRFGSGNRFSSVLISNTDQYGGKSSYPKGAKFVDAYSNNHEVWRSGAMQPRAKGQLYWLDGGC
eukprot:1141280-Pelagomonas_calceolata.AAC.3